MSTLCDCGCGQQTKISDRTGLFNRFITGHNSKVWKTRKPRVTFECIHCKKAVEVMPSLGVNRKFCSTACRDDHRRKLVGEENPKFKRFFVPCARCGQQAERTDKHGNRRPVYCSRECSAASKSEKLSAALKARRSDTWNCYRRLARERDGNACRLCGFAIVLHVHHIIHKSRGGKHHVSNLITLCPNHHAMAHLGHITEAELRSAIASP